MSYFAHLIIIQFTDLDFLSCVKFNKPGTYCLKTANISFNVVLVMPTMVKDNRDHLRVTRERFVRCSPQVMVEDLNVSLKHSRQTLLSEMQFCLELKKSAFRTTVGKLNALNPLKVLERGFSVTRILPCYTVVKDVDQVDVGQRVDVTVSSGGMVCRIERKRKNGQAKNI